MITINPSDRLACRIAGFCYLATFVIVVYTNFGIYNKLSVPGDFAQTTQNIIGNPSLFRFGVVMDILYGIGFVTMTAMLYKVFNPVNQNLGLLAICWQLMYAAVWIVVTIQVLEVFRAMNKNNIQDLAYLESSVKSFLNSRNQRYYGGLPFYAMGTTAFSYLMLKSGIVNRWLAMVSVLSCLWCLVCAVLHFAIPGFSGIVNLWAYDVPMALSQIVISVWLIIKI